MWIQNEVSRHRVFIGNNIQWVSHQSAIQAGIQAEVSAGRSCIIAMTTGNPRSDPHPRLKRHSFVPELAMLGLADSCDPEDVHCLEGKYYFYQTSGFAT